MDGFMFIISTPDIPSLLGGRFKRRRYIIEDVGGLVEECRKDVEEKM